VTERVDVAQTGFFPDDTLVPPLDKRWTIEARGELILAADGRVYLIGLHQIMAVSQADGKQIWSNATETLPVGAAYDNGLLFVTEGDYVRAFNAQTGGQVWQAKLTDVAGPGAPVASGGVVYVTHAQGGSQLHAFRASDGQELWKVAGVSGERSPALDDGRVYLSGACGNAAAYDRRDGSVIWRHKTGCSGGGDFTPALRSGRLWSPDKDDVNGMSADAAVLDAAGGNVVAHHPGGTPLFVDEFGIRSQEEEGITAFNAATGATAWQKKGANTARIAIGHDVYGVTDTRSGGEPSVAAFDSESGDQVWSDGLGSNQASTGSYVSFGAAPGLLIVANNGKVTAYESVFKPAAGGIELGAEPFDAVAGAHISLGGVLGSSLRGTRPAVQVQAAPWRRGSFKGIGDLKPARDGYFSG
jgi:outer membrane protein assembly factor BamB